MRVKPGTIWISGLSAAGKTTLAEGLAEALRQRGVDNVTLLDGEALRARLDRRYGHSLEDRFAVLEQIIAVTRDHTARGELVIVATISHKRQMRELARARLSPLLEVSLRCPVDVCRERDTKDVYGRAEREYVAGVTEPYELAQPPGLVIDTARHPVEDSLRVLIAAAVGFLGLAPRMPTGPAAI